MSLGPAHTSHWKHLSSTTDSHCLRLDAFQPDDESSRIFCVGTNPQIPTAGYLCAIASQFVDSFLDQCVPIDNASGTTVSVVGSGLTGTYIAILLGQKGLKVNLYEKRSELMPAFNNCHHRIIHPNIVLWPKPGWEIDSVTPLLEAAGVEERIKWGVSKASKLRAAFEKLINDSSTITFESNVTVQPPEQKYDRVEYNTSRLGRRRSQFVVLCPGAGEETNYELQSYWKAPDNTEPVDFLLIAGIGDSGIIDAIKAQFDVISYDHEEHGLFRKLISQWEETDGLGYSEIVKAKEEYDNAREKRKDSARAFLECSCDEHLNGLKQVIRGLVAAPKKVVFIAPTDDHYTRKQTFLNQVILRALELEFPGNFQFVSSKVNVAQSGNISIEKPIEILGWNLTGITSLSGTHHGKKYRTLLRTGLDKKKPLELSPYIFAKQQGIQNLKPRSK